MAGNVVGSVSIRVRPDTTRFAADLRKALARIERTMEVKIPVKLDDSGIGTQLKALETRLKAAVADGVKIPVRVDQRGGAGRGMFRLFSRLISAGAAAGEAIGRSFGAALTAITSVIGLAGAGARVASVFAAMGAAVGGVLVVLAAMSVAAAVATVAVGALASAVLAVSGALGGLVGAAPALLAIAPAIAAVAIGMDGIKKAAEVLTPAFDRMKASVSAAFEQGLRPAFEALNTIMPMLTDELGHVATRLSLMAQEAARFITSAQGVQIIKDIFAGFGIVADRAKSSVGELAKQVLITAGHAPTLRVLGDVISNAAGGFARWLETARQSGALTATFAALRDILAAAGRWMRDLVNAGMEFLVAAAPGISKFFDGIRNAFAGVDFTALGKSFGDLVASFGNLNPESVRAFFDNVRSLFDRLTAAIESGVITDIINGLNSLVDAFEGLLDLKARVDGFFKPLSDALNKTSQAVNQNGQDIHNSVKNWLGVKTPQAAGQGAQATANQFGAGVLKMPPTARRGADGAAQGLRAGLAPMPGQAGRIADDTSRRVGSGLDKGKPEASSAGSGMMDGLRSAIAAGQASVISSAVSVALAAWRAAKSALGISSPSKLFIELGHQIARGLELGMLDRKRQVAIAGDLLAAASVPDITGYNPGRVQVSGSNTVTGAVDLNPQSLLALASYIVQALTGSTLKVDGRGVARLVNDVNQRNALR